MHVSPSHSYQHPKILDIWSKNTNVSYSPDPASVHLTYAIENMSLPLRNTKKLLSESFQKYIIPRDIPSFLLTLGVPGISLNIYWQNQENNQFDFIKPIFQFCFSVSVLNILCEPTGGLPGSSTEEFQTVAVG